MAGRLAPIRLALAQIDARVGDIDGNAELIRARTAAAREAGAELVIFPELALTGYPPEDLLLKEHFLRRTRETLEALAAETRDIVALVGFPERTEDVYNACAVLADGGIAAIYRKTHLPNYGVFDEQRYFQAGEGGAVIDFGEARIGLTICEDIWSPGPPESDEALAGASLIVNLSASPYHRNKGVERERMIIQRARDNLCVVAFCNLVGGQDELIFDGHSLVVDHEGNILARGPQFAEGLVVATVDPQSAVTARLRDARLRPPVRRALPEVRHLGRLERPDRPAVRELGGDVVPLLEPEAEVYAALVLGTRDYVEKNGFEHVVLGLSGGIDSSLVALVAVDARGDAQTLARNLGVELLEIPIGPAMDSYDGLLAPSFDGREPDITEENLQARIRGNLLMALSNKFGWLVLTTGNKSENSVGYATLCGDMAGGFAVLKDVYKGWVYKLARWRNQLEGRELVPASVLERPPSAELRYEQRDDESLPPYHVLDRILEGYIEEDLDA